MRKEEKYGDIKKELNTFIELCKSKSLKLRVGFEYRYFTDEELSNWTEFLSKFEIDAIITSFGLLLDDPLDNISLYQRFHSRCKLLPASNLWQPKHVKLAKTSNIEIIRFISLPLLKRYMESIKKGV